MYAGHQPPGFGIIGGGRTVQQRQMITLFCRELSSFQIRHHALCTPINMDEGILNRCHGGYRENFLSASKVVRIEELPFSHSPVGMLVEDLQ